MPKQSGAALWFTMGFREGQKKSPAEGDGASLPRTVSTGAGGLEGPTVRMINAHALCQFRTDPADRALVLLMSAAHHRAAQSKIVHNPHLT